MAAAPYTGWAVEAYPELSAGQMQAMLRRIADAGSNIIWIGHNNPGEAALDKLEPGLSFAVYEAYQDGSDPRHAAAVAIVRAQHRMLRACRAVGVRAVLPVGYQIQMGHAWNINHPQDLRLDALGQPLDIYGGGVSASFYAPSYRQAIVAYYRWVDAEFGRPYSDVLLMLNLADEPIGGDYSSHAEAEFRRRYGSGFAQAQDDPKGQQRLGAFQSHYVVEYAAYSASLWQELHPGLPVTISFDGAQARSTFTMPSVESLFRDTPSNLVITFDAYPHDGLPNQPLTDRDLVQLFLFARSLGFYSALYGRPVWLWAAANSWGLSGTSPEPGTVSDAVANGLSLALLVRQGGGDLQGIAYWNYNVKQQGLYNATHPTAYNPDTLFRQVSDAMPTLRRLMADPPGRPQVLILAPSALAEEQIGAEREAVRREVIPFGELEILGRAGVNAAIVGTLVGLPLQGVQAIVVLAPTEAYISPGDQGILHVFLAEGGKVVASSGLTESLSGPGGNAPDTTWQQLAERHGNLYLALPGRAQSPVEAVAALFDGALQSTLSSFWREVLGVDGLVPGYQVVSDRVAFYYNLGPGAITVPLRIPFEALGFRYDEAARSVAWVHGPYTTATLKRREFILIWALPYTRPFAWASSAGSPQPGQLAYHKLPCRTGHVIMPATRPEHVYPTA